MNHRSNRCFSLGWALWIVLFSILILSSNCFAIEFYLVNASTNSKIRKLTDNDTIDLKEISAVNLLADVQDSDNCARLQFKLNKEKSRILTRIEKVAPYALAGDYPVGNYKTWSVSSGVYELKATAYDEADVRIEEGYIRLTVAQGSGSDNSSADKGTDTSTSSASDANIIYTMVNPNIPAGNRQKGDLKVLKDNTVVYLEDASGRFNVRADLDNQADTRISKFDFFLDGRKVGTERQAPFSLFGDDNGRYKSGTPSTGKHTIKGVAYNNAGAVVSDRSITISVYQNRNSADDASADDASADDASTDDASTDDASTDDASADDASADDASADDDSADDASADDASTDDDSTDDDSTDDDSAETGWPLPEAAKIEDKNIDLISLHFDHSPDPDDGHATVAAKIIMDRYGLKPHVVSGTYAKYTYGAHKNGVENYQPESERVMRTVWGSNWLNAHANWDGAVNKTAEKWLQVLNNGGDIWIAEAGTSDFTAEVIRELQQNQMDDGSAITRQVTRNQIHLVQHGPNAPEEGGYNEDLARPDNLSFVKANTDYHKIDNGNKGEGKEADNRNNSTADFRVDSDTLGDYKSIIKDFMRRAKAHPRYGSMWNQAFKYYSPLNSTPNTCEDVWNEDQGRYVALHSLDFSDTVEVLEILGIGKVGKDEEDNPKVANPTDFADLFLN